MARLGGQDGDPKAIASDALKIYENSIEALLMLAAEEAAPETALNYYQQAVIVAENLKVINLFYLNKFYYSAYF
jgi:hypothetical protein